MSAAGAAPVKKIFRRFYKTFDVAYEVNDDEEWTLTVFMKNDIPDDQIIEASNFTDVMKDGGECKRVIFFRCYKKGSDRLYATAAAAMQNMSILSVTFVSCNMNESAFAWENVPFFCLKANCNVDALVGKTTNVFAKSTHLEVLKITGCREPHIKFLLNQLPHLPEKVKPHVEFDPYTSQELKNSLNEALAKWNKPLADKLRIILDDGRLFVSMHGAVTTVPVPSINGEVDNVMFVHCKDSGYQNVYAAVATALRHKQINHVTFSDCRLDESTFKNEWNGIKTLGLLQCSVEDSLVNEPNYAFAKYKNLKALVITGCQEPEVKFLINQVPLFEVGAQFKLSFDLKFEFVLSEDLRKKLADVLEKRTYIEVDHGRSLGSEFDENRRKHLRDHRLLLTLMGRPIPARNPAASTAQFFEFGAPVHERVLSFLFGDSG